MNTKILPDHYLLDIEIDLQKNRKLAIWLNTLPLLALIPLGILFWLLVKAFPNKIFPGEGTGNLFIFGLILLGSFLLLLVLHEFIHGLVMKHYSKEKGKFGFTGFYAYAGNDSFYFDKPSYIRIALAPALMISILLTLAMLFLNGFWFISLYFLFSMHLIGCVGDFYVVWKLRRYPENTLILDSGTSMRFYTSSKVEK